MATPEWKHRERIFNRKWGDEFLSGKVEEVSEMIPKEPGSNTIILKYLGDECKNTKYTEMKWGNKQFIKIDKHKLEDEI